jgi:hypothetical protein
MDCTYEQSLSVAPACRNGTYEQSFSGAPGVSRDLGVKVGDASMERELKRRRALMYALVVSVIGLPVGLALDLPYVWGLSIAGIIVAGLLLWWDRPS